jgi:hypothetical protein
MTAASSLSYDERAAALGEVLDSMSDDEFESTFGELIEMSIDLSRHTTDEYDSRVNARIRYEDGEVVAVSEPWRVNPAKFRTADCNTPAGDAWTPGTYNRSVSVPTRTVIDSSAEVRERMIADLSAT